MEKEKQYHHFLKAFVLMAAGVLLNIAGTYVALWTGVPLFLDMVGTIFASVLGGYLPGILVALLTNLIRELYEAHSVYYGVLNAGAALLTVLFAHESLMKKA